MQAAQLLLLLLAAGALCVGAFAPGSGAGAGTGAVASAGTALGGVQRHRLQAALSSTSKDGPVALLRRARDSQCGELGTAVATGLVVGLAVKSAKSVLAVVEGARRGVWATPLVGGVFVSFLYMIRNDISVGAASIGTEDQFSLQRQLLRFLAVIVVVGTGNALALAGPAAEFGMTIARVLSGGATRQGGISKARPLILAGAAAGFSANFDAPLSATLYALEVAKKSIYGPPTLLAAADQVASSQKELNFLMLAAYASSVVVRGRLGFPSYTRGPLAQVSYPVLAGVTYPLIFAIGIAAGALTAFIQGPLYESIATTFFLRMPRPTRAFFGGAINAATEGVGLSQSLPALYRAYGAIAEGRVSGIALAKFLAVKIFCIQTSLASGLIGGAVAPFLIVGSALGALFAGQAPAAASSVVAVASASVLAAFYQAPLTFAVLIVEMTQQLHLAAPLLLVTAVSASTSDVVTQWLRRVPARQVT